jgi:hypothetical protein
MVGDASGARSDPQPLSDLAIGPETAFEEIIVTISPIGLWTTTPARCACYAMWRKPKHTIG